MKKILTFVFVFFIFAIPTNSAHAFSGSGAGTSGDPYQITTCLQLQAITESLSSSYKQMNDIDCTGTSFFSIGNGSDFTGTFDGQNYSINNITISSNGSAGFFSNTLNANIRNVRLISGSVSSTGTNPYIGSLIGGNNGGTVVSHVFSNLTLNNKSGAYVGGLIGWSENGITIQKSAYIGNIIGNVDLSAAGGLIAGVEDTGNTISDSYTSGNWVMHGAGYAGGFIGLVYSGITITNSYSSGVMERGGGGGEGGFISGYFAGTISNSFSSTAISNSAGGDGGMFWSGNGVSTGNYFDAYLAGVNSCSASGSASCTAKNSGNSDPNYFKGNSTSSPMSTWNFTDIWQVNSGGYPTLRGFISPSSGFSSSSSSSSTPPSCTTQAPLSAPNLFQMGASGTTANLFFAPVSGANSSYVISYGFDENANNFATLFNYGFSSGVISYNINSLFPGKWYFKIRGQNGCMPGEWSSVKSIKII